MGRPRSFDADVVLDKAADAFRSKGFKATSLEDLEKATGLRRASLYGAFKDKHSLYVASLKRYDQTRTVRLVAQLDAEPTGRKALEKLFELVVGECEGSAGCLMQNAAMERGRKDAEADRHICENRRRLEGAVHAALARGRADGSLKKGGDVAAAARLVLCVSLGLRAMSKAGAPCAQLREVIQLTLETL